MARGMIFWLLALFYIAWRPAVPAMTQREYVLREHLDYAWPRQMIRFELAFDAGAGQAVTSVTANGEPVFFQTPEAETTRHEDGSLATAGVYVITALDAGQTILFKAELDADRALLPEADLRVSEVGDVVTLETAAGAGVRLPLGEFSGEDIPAPYQGFKLTTGRWTGPSRLMGEPGPERLEARIAERGPVFAEVQLHYSYSENRAYTLRCRVIAGQPVALVTEEFDTERGGLHFTVFRDHPTRFGQGRFGLGQGFKDSHWVRVPLDGFRPDLVALESFADKLRCISAHATVKADDPWLATLHPWHNWHGGVRMLPLHNDDDYLGLMSLRAGQWNRYPMQNLIMVRQDNGEIYLQVPINNGRRKWGVHFGTPDAARPTGEGLYPHFTNATALRRARIRHGETALDTVKDWILSWGDEVPVPNPVGVHPPGDLAAVQARFRDVPELAGTAGEVIANWNRHWADKTDEDLGPPAYRALPGQHRSIGALSLCSAEAEHAEGQFRVARALGDWAIRQTLDGVGHTGYPRGHSYGVLSIIGLASSAIQMTDSLLGSPHISDRQKAQLRARLAFFAHLLSDPDYWPHIRDIGKGTANMAANRDGTLGVIGCVLAGHPKADEWRQMSIDRVENLLLEWNIRPDGVMREGLHYSGVTMDSILPFMAMLVNAGGTNYYEDERLMRGLTWYASVCPPVDVRFDRAYMPPFGYSHLTDASQSARWALLAAMTRESSPEFAALMMDTWERQGRPTSLAVGGQAAVGMIDPLLTFDSPPVRRSQRWETFGAVLRAHADTDRETYMAICDSGGDWGSWANESAGFHFYAKGVPMSLIPGARSYFDPAAWHSGLTQNRVLFDRREEPNNTRRVGEQTWVTLPSADLFGTQFRFSRLQGRAMVFEGDEEDPGTLELSEPRPWPKGAPDRDAIIPRNIQSRLGAFEDVPPQNWQRRVMFVKDKEPLGPNYFLIRDSLAGTLPTEWNLWAMSEETPEIEGQRASFRGKYGVDMAVFFAERPRNIVTGAWGSGDGARRRRGRVFERQRLLQLQRDANQDYLVVLYPHTEDEEVPEFSTFSEGRGVRLEWDERTDHLVLSDEAVEVEADGLRFSGEAGLAQRGEDWMRLTLLVGDTIGLDGFALTQRGSEAEAADSPGEDSVSVTALMTPQRRLAGEAVGMARQVMIHVPVVYAGLTELRINGEPAPLRAEGDGVYSFRLPAGRHGFEIRVR